MTIKVTGAESLNKIRSEDHLNLLDAIDGLRSHGISHYVSLPQIIVCGDQSSGKSSVLEALSGVSFPTKSTLCTRFPVELILRRTPHVDINISIVPDQHRKQEERELLNAFRESLDDFANLPRLMEKAGAKMGITPQGKAFSRDVLRIEVSGPDRPQLTIIDLPGLIHSETEDQSEADVDLIKDVVQQYMQESRSIILAVISAKNDPANQIVLKLARAADKIGTRTLGVITKPDTLIPGSKSERSFISLARNQVVKFRLGWHVLKNMDSDKGSSTLEERDREEEDFLSQGIWSTMAASELGISSLRQRLSRVLLDQIAAELPGLVKEIERKRRSCIDKINKLGRPRTDPKEQREYLLEISQSFQFLVKAAVDGTYNDVFFGNAKTPQGYQKRIRAVVQNLEATFATDMHTGGQHRRIISDSEEIDDPEILAITRDDYIEEIRKLKRRTRGRELPGMFNHMIVIDLFREQSAPWTNIARQHIKEVYDSVKTFIKLAIDHISDEGTSNQLWKTVFEPSLSRTFELLERLTEQFLEQHQRGHPITYNPRYLEDLDQVRQVRNRENYQVALKKFFGADNGNVIYHNRSLNLDSLLDTLVESHPSINDNACLDTLDCMEVYYKVIVQNIT
jgi:GTP-binding protein EngB required for normal cell division